MVFPLEVVEDLVLVTVVCVVGLMTPLLCRVVVKLVVSRQ